MKHNDSLWCWVTVVVEVTSLKDKGDRYSEGKKAFQKQNQREAEYKHQLWNVNGQGVHDWDLSLNNMNPRRLLGMLWFVSLYVVIHTEYVINKSLCCQIKNSRNTWNNEFWHFHAII